MLPVNLLRFRQWGKGALSNTGTEAAAAAAAEAEAETEAATECAAESAAGSESAVGRVHQSAESEADQSTPDASREPWSSRGRRTGLRPKG